MLSKMDPDSWRNESGVTVVELLVGLGIAGIVVLALAGVFGQFSGAVGNLKDRFAREQVRFMLRQRLDCPATIVNLPSPCANGTRIALYDGSVELIPTAGKTIDGIELRASCSEKPRDFLVEFRHNESPWASLFAINLGCAPD